MKLNTLFLLTSLVILACGRPDSENPESSEEEISRGIINGTSSGHAAVLNAGCTVTVIGPRTVIGVAHCLHPTTPSTGVRTVTLKSGRKVNINFTAHPSYRDTENYDLSIGIAPSDLEVSGRMLSDVQTKGGSAYMVGYGCNTKNGAGYGQQRQGNVFITKINTAGLVATGPATCGGDSGGPLIQASKIVGVVSRARGGTTYFARVDKPEIRSWLLSMATKYNAPICGFQDKGCQMQLYPKEIKKFTDAGVNTDKAILTTQTQINTLTTKINTESTNINTLKTQVSTQKGQLKKLDSDIAAGTKAGTDVKGLQIQRTTLAALLVSTEAKLTKANETINLLRTQLATARGALNKLKTDKFTYATELKKYRGY